MLLNIIKPRYLIIALLTLIISACSSGIPDTPYLWTWISGSSGVDQAGVYGTEDVADPANVPGAREQAVTWRDANNNLWLFGGNGYDKAPTLELLNDLWKFDGSNWTWVSGDDTAGNYGVYNSHNYDAINKPGGRRMAMSWRNGATLWLFGGYGYAASGGLGHLNGLWKFNGTNWAWVSGSNSVDQPGDYDNADPSLRVPGARRGAITWIDASGNLWLFGGYGYDKNGAPGYLNDLWMFDGTNWSWVSGSDDVTTNYLSDYDNADPSLRIPGAREGATAWIDGNGDLWLFGGYGFTDAASGNLNDLWKFDISTSQWTWMGGTKLINQAGSYGTLRVANPSNIPGARRDAVAEIDSNGHVWLFAGYGEDKDSALGYLSDLWRFDGTNWTWISGSDVINQSGTYGVKGTADEANTPGGRQYSVSWINSYSEIWIFGGLDPSGRYNDLWRFVP